MPDVDHEREVSASRKRISWSDLPPSVGIEGLVGVRGHARTKSVKSASDCESAFSFLPWSESDSLT